MTQRVTPEKDGGVFLTDFLDGACERGSFPAVGADPGVLQPRGRRERVAGASLGRGRVRR